MTTNQSTKSKNLNAGSSSGGAPRTLSRAFCLTVNNYTERDVSALQSLDGVLHLVCGRETAPTTGTPHLQVYLRMKRPYRLTTVIKWFPTAHVEVAKAGDAASNYCRKEDLLFEIDNRKRKGARSDLDSFARAVREKPDNELFEEFPGHFLRFGQHLQRIRDLDGPSLRDPPDVHWYHGGTGTGKTRKAFETDPGLWAAPPGPLKWFDGYHGQETVLFDDIREDDIRYHVLLRLLDRYPMRVPIKGGFTNWSPKRIIITAPKGPEEFFECLTEDIGQLRRRITKVVHFAEL